MSMLLILGNADQYFPLPQQGTQTNICASLSSRTQGNSWGLNVCKARYEYMDFPSEWFICFHWSGQVI